jgi:hypothetical protein
VQRRRNVRYAALLHVELLLRVRDLGARLHRRVSRAAARAMSERLSRAKTWRWLVTC